MTAGQHLGSLHSRGYDTTSPGPVRACVAGDSWRRLLAFSRRLLTCKRLLVVGPGRHQSAQLLRSAGFAGEIATLDASRWVASAAIRPEVSPVRGRSRLGCPDGYFDGLLCCGILEHLEPEMLAPTLGELARAVAPGGRWAIAVGPRLSPWQEPQAKRDHAIRNVTTWWAQKLRHTPFASPLAIRSTEEGVVLRGLRAGVPLRFQDWFHESGGHSHRWLVLGKGPSFERLNKTDTTGYRVLGLNHTVRETCVDVAHAIDIEVVHDLGHDLLSHASHVVLPWHPHVDFQASAKTLADFTRELPVLQALADEGRLLTYDLGTWPGPHSMPEPLVAGGWFSGDVVVQLLSRVGARTIHTLGLDGGSSYAQSFSELTPLENGQPSFDRQTQAIQQLASAYKLDYGPIPAPPRLTIVLVTWNARQQVEELLAGIDALTRSPHELVIVDNGSEDGTREWLLALPRRRGLLLVCNEENQRCAAATNQALARCRTEFVVYLCASHAVVTKPGWETPLLEYMDAHPEVCLAGDVWNPGYPLASGRYAQGWSCESHGLEKLRHVQGGAWIARRRLFEELGPFNEAEYPHGGMDVEFSYRMLSRGLPLGDCPAIRCPPWPMLPARHPAVGVCHPAPPALRTALRRELGLPVRPRSKQAIIFCERTGAPPAVSSVIRALGDYYDVQLLGPGWPTSGTIDLEQVEFYLELDTHPGEVRSPPSSLLRELAARNVPRFSWIWHMTPRWTTGRRAPSADVDMTFCASPALARAISGTTQWLPLHSDPRQFRPRVAERDYDITSTAQTPEQTLLLGRIAKRHGLSMASPAPDSAPEGLAALFRRSKLVVHRNVSGELDCTVMDVMGSGRVLLTDAQHNGQYALFEDRRHYVLYKDAADLERLVLQFLDADDHRRQIEHEASAVIARHHTTTVRVAQLISSMRAFRARRADAS